MADTAAQSKSRSALRGEVGQLAQPPAHCDFSRPPRKIYSHPVLSIVKRQTVRCALHTILCRYHSLPKITLLPHRVLIQDILCALATQMPLVDLQDLLRSGQVELCLRQVARGQEGLPNHARVGARL